MASTRVELRLLLPYLVSILLVCLGHPVSYCLFQRLKFHAHPSLLVGWVSTDVQVNNTVTPHLMYTDTHIYITFTLLFILFFTLLLLPLADQLAQTFPILNTYISFFLNYIFPENCFANLFFNLTKEFKSNLLRSILINLDQKVRRSSNQFSWKVPLQLLRSPPSRSATLLELKLQVTCRQVMVCT